MLASFNAATPINSFVFTKIFFWCHLFEAEDKHLVYGRTKSKPNSRNRLMKLASLEALFIIPPSILLMVSQEVQEFIERHYANETQKSICTFPAKNQTQDILIRTKMLI